LWRWLASRGREAATGGAEGGRTPDLLIANEALSQLSYGPAKNATVLWVAAGAGHLRPGMQGVKDRPAAPPWGPRREPRLCVDASAATRLSSLLRLASSNSSAGSSGCIPMNPFLWLIHTLIWLYIYVLIAAAVMSWLIAFNVVNSHNPTVRAIWDFLYRVTEPGLRPIRAILPNLGGIDISPVILIIALMFLDQLIVWLYVSIFG
jgi:YggT family protein